MTRYAVPLILALTFILAACGSGGMGNMSGSIPAGAAGLTKTVDGVKVDVTLNPATLDSKTNTVADITLTNAQSQPITQGRVVVTLTAAVMPLNPVVVQAEAKGNGVYSATLKPTGHSGGHTLTVDVQSQGKAYQAKFDGFNIK